MAVMRDKVGFRCNYANVGFDEGKPGFRDRYGSHFYVGYLRDPQGNKIALFSNDPIEPG